jgi:hypothetical protein
MFISLRVLILLAASELQISLNLSSGRAEGAGFTLLISENIGGGWGPSSSNSECPYCESWPTKLYYIEIEEEMDPDFGNSNESGSLRKWIRNPAAHTGLIFANPDQIKLLAEGKRLAVRYRYFKKSPAFKSPKSH